MTVSEDSNTSVRVAVRIRPQNGRERLDMCRKCVNCLSDQCQIVLGKDKAFTYDYVYDEGTEQDELFTTCTQALVKGCFEGYNATVLAYGQTGSGKTFTMGTAFDTNLAPESEGIIPRAVKYLFDEINISKQKAVDENLQPPEYQVTAQFLELYNEEIIDLLDRTRNTDSKFKKNNLKVHEDQNGDIYVAGATSRVVVSPQDTAICLQDGTLLRTTASTNMNAQSSRSHAIFTLRVKQHRYIQGISQSDEMESYCAKFHFVDLAGSERLKRTGATGDRAKEGISINCGLLSLGNVISALGDKSKKASHVPYRDSKLTRLLQDSLGGNSRTLMIACASPSDCDFMETLNTLKYANRARNIKNKVIVNQDQTSKEIAALRAEIQQLRNEVMEYRQGKRTVGSDGELVTSDLYNENIMLQTEVDRLRCRVKAMQQIIDSQMTENINLESSLISGEVKNDGDGPNINKIIEKYVSEISALKLQLAESQLSKQSSDISRSGSNVDSTGSYEDLLKTAKHLCETDLQKINKGNTDKNEAQVDAEDESETEEELKDDVLKLTQEITVKQRLIAEIESSHDRINLMRSQYEEKLHILQKRIEAAKTERDQILKSIESIGSGSEEKASQIKTEYEKKIANLYIELKKLKGSQKEHNKLLKEKAQHEQQLDVLRTDLQRIREAKAKLINQMKEDANKNKLEGVKKSREIAQLRKQNRQKEITIRNLESDKKRREVVLKRKLEEVEVLRREKKQMQPASQVRERRPVSAPAVNNSTVTREAVGSRISKLVGASTKKKWRALKETLTQYIANKQALRLLESEVEHFMQERERLKTELDECKMEISIASENQEDEELEDLNERLEGIIANLEFIQESISERQNEIMHLTEAKDEYDPLCIISSCAGTQEAKSLMENLVWDYIDKRIIMYEQEKSNTRIKEKLSLCEKQLKVQDTFIHQHLRNRDTLEQYVLECNMLSRQPFKSPDKKNRKYRRKTFVPKDLIFGRASIDKNTKNALQSSSEPVSDIYNHGAVSMLSHTGVDLANRRTQSFSHVADTLRDNQWQKGDNLERTSSVSSTSRDPAPNVFARLTPDTGSKESDQGRFVLAKSSSNSGKSTFTCTYEARGHTTAILCLDICKNMLFSGSKDGAIKVWDVKAGQELMTLSKNGIKDTVAIQYSPSSGLLFAANRSNIMVWDPREFHDKCIQMLSISTSGSTNSSQKELSSGRLINDIKICDQNSQLFSTDGSFVRVWDIRKFQNLSKLTVGHTAAITTLAVSGNSDNRTTTVVTGSKDHSIKLLQVTDSDDGIQSAKYNLEPPHYDGIQVVKIIGDSVISGSRDNSIKQWNWKNCQFIQSVPSAHKDWICAINCLPSKNRIVSGCRGGILRLWNVENFSCVGNIKAHRHSINSIVTGLNQVYTASNDGVIKVWSIAECDS